VSLSKWLDGWSPEAFDVGAAKARFDEQDLKSLIAARRHLSHHFPIPFTVN
jgi:hypothetical protein